MKKATLFLAILLACGCDTVKHRHLRCTDESGAVVVDTTNIRNGVQQTDTAWVWSRHGGSRFKLSVPPHSCSYMTHKTRPNQPCSCPAHEDQVELDAVAPAKEMAETPGAPQ